MRYKNHPPISAFDLLSGCFPRAKLSAICALLTCSALAAKADLRSDYQDQQYREAVCNKLWGRGQFEEVGEKSRYIVDYKLATFTKISIRNTDRVGKDLKFDTYCKVGSPIRLNKELWPVKGGGFSEKMPLQFDLDDLIAPPKKSLFVIEEGSLVRYFFANDPESLDSRVSRVVIALKRKG